MAKARWSAWSGQVLGLTLGFLASHATAETLGDALVAAYRTNPGLQARRDRMCDPPTGVERLLTDQADP